MALQQHDFIECPSCKKKLPAAAVRCHFCGADASKVARVAAPVRQRSAAFETPSYVKGLYVAVCIWWMLSGIIQVAEIAQSVANRKPDPFGIVTPGWGAFDYAFAGLGALTFLFGIGLLLKVRAIRKIVNVISALNILGGLFGLLSGLAIMTVSAGLGFFIVVSNLIDIIVGAATIWLLSETSSWEEAG